MAFDEKLGKFFLFIFLTFITFGIYPLWWFIMIEEERSRVLKEIRDLQKEIRDSQRQRS